MDLRNQPASYGPNENPSWLGSAHATDTGHAITLDLELFDEDDYDIDGAIPSGIALGKVTATGKYGPYGGTPNEVQVVTVDATSGNFTLDYDGQETANIAFDATAAAVLAALVALSNIAPGDVSVTGDDGGPWTVTFGGTLAAEDVAELIPTDVDLAGGGDEVTVETTQEGGPQVSDGRETASGLLLTTITSDQIGEADAVVNGAILRHGQVVEANLPTGHGIDATAKTHLSGFRFV